MFLKLKKSFAKAWSRTNLTFVLVFKFWVSQVDLSEKLLLLGEVLSKLNSFCDVIWKRLAFTLHGENKIPITKIICKNTRMWAKIAF